VQGFNRSGRRKGINEELAKLIRLKFGVNINEDHNEIKAILKCQNTDITGLIESSDALYLKQAITMYSVLEELEKIYRQLK